MPSSDSPGLSMPFATFRRSVFGLGNDRIHSLESNRSPLVQNTEFELFQSKVFKRFHDLSIAKADEFLSLSWVSKLLDALIECQEEFRVLLCKHKVEISKPPLDKMVSDYFERSIKALDICNATRDGVDMIRLWNKHLDMVLSAFGSQQRIIGEGTFRRARKALTELALVMLDDKGSGSVVSHRNKSFGWHNKGKEQHYRLPGHSRSLSWSVSNSWSATKQLQSIAYGVVPPRAHEITETNGLAVPIFTMSFVLMFVLWALVAAIPCQDRSLQIHFSIPRQFSWSTPFYLIHVRIMDESKKRDRRSSVGLLQEIYQLESSVRRITDVVDSVHFPMTEEQKEESKLAVKESSLVCETCRTGMDPLERQLREVFRKIMSSRIEGLAILGREN
ncbi:protein BYPASS1-LIKE-like [Apium graveolens]|uniref:protein BYPASS1-LIKE-like n=1 Tax=Apium graveolens TaxID=4045 RepID=UPI003D7AEC11